MPLTPRRTSPDRLAHAERQLKALELRKQGLSYEAIARKLGLKDRQRAWRDVTTALKALRTEAADEVRSLEVERLDDLLRKLYPLAMGKNTDMAAVDRILRIMERRAKLMGLDAPTTNVLSADVGAAIVIRYADEGDRTAEADALAGDNQE